MTTTTADRIYQFQQTATTADVVVDTSEEFVSDEADDLVIALLVKERLARSTKEALSLEDSMRALGVDPAEFGLE
jgi:hypothetical protein